MRAWNVSVLLAALFVAPLARGASLDPNFTQVEIPGEYLPYTGMAWAPDGSDRLFLTTKVGTTRILQAGALLPTPFMTTSPYQGSECGLLSVAFDPNFGENGFVYFFVTSAVEEQRIVRYRADGNVGVDPTVIVSGLPTRGLNHDGGALAFGPDGKLYWAIGDLGNGTGAGADLTLLASKVGRVNRDGSVPTDNPFYDGMGPNEDRIWASGFRNPFTMTFQPSTGRMWLDVVGTSMEQVFVVGRGDNGGWGTYEALQPQGFIRAVLNYPTNGTKLYGIVPTGATRTAGVATFTTGAHTLLPGERVTVAGVTEPSFDGSSFVKSISDTTFSIDQAGPDAMSGGGSVTTPLVGGCITGGVFYDSTAASAEYRGNFFFGDYNSGNLMRAALSGGAVRSVTPFATAGGAVDMSLGPDGDLYVATHAGLALYKSRFLATKQYLVVSRSNLWMLEDGVAAFNVRLSMAATAAVDVRVRLPSARSTLSITSGAALTFGPSDWSVPKPVEISSARDDDADDDVTELTVAALDLPVESVRVRVIDEYAAVTPPEGGAGGEAGSTGEGGEGITGGRGGSGGSTGTDGGAGSDTGGTATGGRGTGGGAGAAIGAAGEGGAGEPPGNDQADGESDGGCGCAMSRRSGGGAAILLVALAFLRRRARR